MQQKLFHSDTLAIRDQDARHRPFTTVKCYCGRLFRIEDFRNMGKLCDRCKEQIIQGGGSAKLPGGIEIRYTGGSIECERPSEDGV